MNGTLSSSTLSRKNEYIAVLFLAILIFLVHIRNVTSFGIFSILDDEFGYWGNAAYFLGYDWSDSISEIPYFSYGYSLILTPIYWLFKNPVTAYQVALIINGLMVSASFIVCYKVSKLVTKSISQNFLLLISFIIALYPAYISYSNIAWPEITLMFCTWLLIWCFAVINSQSSYVVFFLIGLLSAFTYVTHQRTIGILLSSIFILIIMTLIGEIRPKKLLVSFIPIILVMLCHYFIKNDLLTNLWLQQDGELTNDYSAQFSKILEIFTADGLIKFAKTLLGHIFYIGASSMLISYFGIYYIFSRSYRSIKSLLANKNIGKVYLDSKPYFYIFLSLVFISTLLINVIFMIHPTRVDQIVYGRYIDSLQGILLLFGCVQLWETSKLSSLRVWSICVGFLLLSIIMFGIINSSELQEAHVLQSTGLVFSSTPFGVMIPAFIAILLFRLIVMPIVNKKTKMIASSLIILLITFISMGFIIETATITINKSAITIKPVVEYMQNTDEDRPIYYIWNEKGKPQYSKWDNRNTRYRMIADCYQFLLKSKRLLILDISEINTISVPCYVITNDPSLLKQYSTEFKYCMEAAGSVLYVSKTN